MKEEELIRAIEHRYPGMRDTFEFWVGTRCTTGGVVDEPIPEEEQYAEIWSWPGGRDYPDLDQQRRWVEEWRSSDDYEEYLAENVRDRRNELLRAVDSFAMKPLLFQELPEQERTSIQMYRRSLLDITNQSGFPHAVDWPEVPDILK